MTIQWEQHFPLSTLACLTMVGSNHCLQLLDTGETKTNFCRQFFEKQWLKQDDVLDLVGEKWRLGKQRCTDSICSLDKWHGVGSS